MTTVNLCEREVETLARRCAERVRDAYVDNNWTWISPRSFRPYTPTCDDIVTTIKRLITQIRVLDHCDNMATGRLMVQVESGDVEVYLHLGSSYENA